MRSQDKSNGENFKEAEISERRNQELSKKGWSELGFLTNHDPLPSTDTPQHEGNYPVDTFLT